MPITSPDIVASAKKLRPDAVRQMLQDQAPGVYRLAYALSGRWDVGRGIARFVLNRSVRMMPKWGPETEPVNWYNRFTIQISRRSAKHQPKPGKDVLIEQAIQPIQQEYVAFVAAVRKLDTQQREAFLLRYGERLQTRSMALAMDCSTEAADNHLRMADQSLRLVAGANFDALSQKLADAFAHLTPDSNDLVPSVNTVVFRKVRLAKWIRRIITLILLAVLAGLLWGGWKLYTVVRT
jgi:DNA-directed RNA polymerase specialized sigma24 family protein